MLKKILRKFPDLPRKLRAARMADSPEYYLKKSIMGALMFSFGIVIIGFLFTKSLYALFAIFLYPILFLYIFHIVDMKMIAESKKISEEIVYAGRFLIIELESGVSLYHAFSNVAQNYPAIGLYFQEIVDRVNLGTSMEDALNEILEYLPSDSLRKMLWQIINSLRTGSEVADSLQIAVEHIVREQKIQVVEYGRKLNPLAMFYMMMAVILPSLGTTMLIVLATFIGFTLSLPVLLIVAGALLFIQFMFLAAIKSQRPAVAF